MATKTDTKPTEVTPEPSPQQTVNDAILKVVAATGIDVQKNRYKAMRAIAWQAFANSIEAGAFEKLVAQAIANVGSLPSGWEIEPPKRAAEAAPKTTGRRPTR